MLEKLDLHTESTLQWWEVATSMLGAKLHLVKKDVTPYYLTKESPNELKKRVEKEEKIAAASLVPLPGTEIANKGMFFRVNTFLPAKLTCQNVDFYSAGQVLTNGQDQSVQSRFSQASFIRTLHKGGKRTWCSTRLLN